MGHRKVCFGSSINIDTLEAANACVPLDQMQCYSTPPSTHGSKHNPVTDAMS